MCKHLRGQCACLVRVLGLKCGFSVDWGSIEIQLDLLNTLFIYLFIYLFIQLSSAFCAVSREFKMF